MRELFFDTETTDRWNFIRPADDPCQPHLVQLALNLTEDEKRVASLYMMVQTSVPITPGAFGTHGISQETAERLGVSQTNAAYIFRDMVASAEVIVAHNIQFDRSVMTKALRDAGVPEIPWTDIKNRCTMLAATPVVGIRTQRGLKWPSLTECMQFFFEETLDGAHDAMVDVNGCERVYRELVKLNVFRD